MSKQKCSIKTNLKQGQNSPKNSPQKPPENSDATTLLDRQETSPHPDSPNPLKAKIITALRTHSEGEKIAGKLENCGDIIMGTACKMCGYPHPLTHSCKLLICPDCAKKRQGRLVDKRKEKLAKMKNPKSVTLTVRNITDLGKSDIDFIRDSYTKLRRRKPYKHILDGSFYGIEPKSKLTPAGKLEWNLHLHTLVDMKYRKDACKTMKNANTPEAEKKVKKERCVACENKCLRYDWEDITGSPVVDVRGVRKAKSRKRALYYVAGDFVKGQKHVAEDIEDLYILGVVLVILVLVLKNVRMVQATGSMLKGKILTYNFTCPICGAVNWSLPFAWTDQHALQNYLMRKEKKRSPP